MPQLSDTKLFHKSFKEAGFRQHPSMETIRVFNDKHKSGETRRLKLVDGDGVFAAPQFVQEDLEWTLKNNFGDRYLFGQFIARPTWHGRGRKSFVVYLLAA
jgi:hypothetical protein